MLPHCPVDFEKSLFEMIKTALFSLFFARYYQKVAQLLVRMIEGEQCSPELMDLLQALAQDSCEIDGLISDLQMAFDSLYPPPHCAQQFSGINAKYTDVVSRIDAAIRQCQRGIAMIEGEPTSPLISAITSAASSALPSRSPSVAQFPTPSASVTESFFEQDLPHYGLPFPPLCGAVPLEPGCVLPVSSFVAAMVDDHWTLCRIVAVDDTTYDLRDAVSSEDSNVYTAKHSDVIPLPTSLPDRRTRFAEYAAGQEVLALWLDGDVWTSVFYKAVVVKPPSETGDDYRLKYLEDSGDKLKSVPASYVVRAPTV